MMMMMMSDDVFAADDDTSSLSNIETSDDDNEDDDDDVEVDGSCYSDDDINFNVHQFSCENFSSYIKDFVKSKSDELVILKPKGETCNTKVLSFFVCPSSDTYQSDDDDTDDCDSPTTSADIPDFSDFCVSGLYIPPSDGTTLCSSPVSYSFDSELLDDIDNSNRKEQLVDDDVVFSVKPIEEQLMRVEEVNAWWRQMYPSENGKNDSSCETVANLVDTRRHKTVSVINMMLLYCLC